MYDFLLRVWITLTAIPPYPQVIATAFIVSLVGAVTGVSLGVTVVSFVLTCLVCLIVASIQVYRDRE